MPLTLTSCLASCLGAASGFFIFFSTLACANDALSLTLSAAESAADRESDEKKKKNRVDTIAAKIRIRDLLEDTIVFLNVYDKLTSQ